MKYNIQENVQIVISALKQYNIRHIVISPGGTNIPVIQAVQEDSFFHCYSVPDERSAMYFAIGVYLQTGDVVATSCTSAQATRNYIPGLTEAFYKHVPILAITTSKLERFQYQEYMQSPDQCSLPRDSVKKSYDLPPVTDDNTRKLCYYNARDAILELTHRKSGPVQLNIRIDDSRQNLYENLQLPNIYPLKRYMAWDCWDDINLCKKKILIIIGEHRPFSKRQQIAIDNFCKCYNVVVYVNHLSNFQNEYSIQANLLVSVGGMNYLQPDLFITIGGQTGDYPVFDALCNQTNSEHWRVSEDGDNVDTYNCLTKIFECPDYYFFERLSCDKCEDHSFFKEWKSLNDKMVYDIELPFSNLYVAQQLYRRIPLNSIVNFAILNCLRCWNYFPMDSSIHCFSNVSAFGIDGCNSMLIGESVNTDNLCFIITGDLAFFYDMNSLGIRHIGKNVRVLLVNNSGGAIFNVMTNRWKQKIDVSPFISACGHNGNAKGWAENCGFNYFSATNKEEFHNVLNNFISEQNSPALLEVFTRPSDEVESFNSFLLPNRIIKKGNITKRIIGYILGQ